MGQKGTLGPSSWESARASAVLPVPGAPAKSTARPAIFLVWIKLTMTPAASLAASCPTKPAPMGSAVPSGLSPRPLMCVWTAVLIAQAFGSVSQKSSIVSQVSVSLCHSRLGQRTYLDSFWVLWTSVIFIFGSWRGKPIDQLKMGI
jgi:hypothetical protein